MKGPEPRLKGRVLSDVGLMWEGKLLPCWGDGDWWGRRGVDGVWTVGLPDPVVREKERESDGELGRSVRGRKALWKRERGIRSRLVGGGGKG